MSLSALIDVVVGQIELPHYREKRVDVFSGFCCLKFKVTMANVCQYSYN